MHDSRFNENEKKHKVAIFENKHAQGRPNGKGYMIDTACCNLSNFFRSFSRLRWLRVLQEGSSVAIVKSLPLGLPRACLFLYIATSCFLFIFVET